MQQEVTDKMAPIKRLPRGSNAEPARTIVVDEAGVEKRTAIMSTIAFRTAAGIQDGPNPKAEVGSHPQAACLVCGAALISRRSETRYCGGRCRVIASRERRRVDLQQRLQQAEEALTSAASVLNDLRVLVKQGSEGIVRGGTL